MAADEGIPMPVRPSAGSSFVVRYAALVLLLMAAFLVLFLASGAWNKSSGGFAKPWYPEYRDASVLLFVMWAIFAPALAWPRIRTPRFGPSIAGNVAGAIAGAVIFAWPPSGSDAGFAVVVGPALVVFSFLGVLSGCLMIGLLRWRHGPRSLPESRGSVAPTKPT